MTTNRSGWSAVIGLVLLSTGCGGGGGATDAGTPGTDTGPRDGPAATRCNPAGPAVSLEGTWAIRATLEVRLSERSGGIVHLCPNPQTTQASLLFKMAVRGTGTTIMEDIQVCQVNLPQARGNAGDCGSMPLTIALTPSRELTAYLPMFRIPTLTTTLESTRPCAMFRPARFNVLLGVRAGALMNPETDPLPTWCSPCSANSATQCICRDCMQTGAACASRATEGEDSDGDGQPGVTVQVASNDPGRTITGRAFLALRTRPGLTGQIIDANRVTGTIDAPLDYAILGSDVTIGAALETAAVVSALPNFTFVPNGSEFTMLRADGDQLARWDVNGDRTVTCEEIAARVNNFR